jgi:translation initiation factor 2 subunit 1
MEYIPILMNLANVVFYTSRRSRVTKRERIEKIKSWKKERKGDALLYVIAERAGLSKDETYQRVGVALEEEFGLYEGFEKVVKEGIDFLVKLGISEDLAKVIAQVAEERIRIKTVKARGILEIRCRKPNGVRCIQEAFRNAKKSQEAKNCKIEFSVIAAPKYRIEVSTDQWKSAEDILEKTSQNVVANITDAGGSGEFKPEKSCRR